MCKGKGSQEQMTETVGTDAGGVLRQEDEEEHPIEDLLHQIQTMEVCCTHRHIPSHLTDKQMMTTGHHLYKGPSVQIIQQQPEPHLLQDGLNPTQLHVTVGFRQLKECRRLKRLRVASFGVVEAQKRTANSFNGWIHLQIDKFLLPLLPELSAEEHLLAISRVIAAMVAPDGVMGERTYPRNVGTMISRMKGPFDSVSANKMPSRGQ